MSPEELDELRKSAVVKMVQCIGIQNAAVCRHPYNGVNNASFALVNLPDLLAHIDSQAAQIKQLEDHNDLLQNELFELRKGKDAQEAISDLMAQIEALKEMLVSMTTTAIWKASYDSLTGKYTISDADAEKMARQQLKAEIPGVEWE